MGRGAKIKGSKNKGSENLRQTKFEGTKVPTLRNTLTYIIRIDFRADLFSRTLNFDDIRADLFSRTPTQRT